jgi:hypothetical protein
VRGHLALRELVRDAMLPAGTTARVHMGVFSSCLGLRLQTLPCCYLENKLGYPGPLEWLQVGGRCMDQCNVVRLTVRDWAVTGLPRACWPVSNDIVLTGKGSVMHRLTWNGVGCGLEWTDGSEASVLQACQWVSDRVGAAC